MCFGGSPPATSIVKEVPAAAPPPPAPANQAPKPPEIDPNVKNRRESASQARKGTSIFRNDLTIPVGADPGNGVNIPSPR